MFPFFIYTIDCHVCLDGNPGDSCNTCTNNLCDCPGGPRNGFPCQTAIDVTIKIFNKFILLGVLNTFFALNEISH